MSDKVKLVIKITDAKLPPAAALDTVLPIVQRQIRMGLLDGHATDEKSTVTVRYSVTVDK